MVYEMNTIDKSAFWPGVARLSAWPQLWRRAVSSMSWALSALFYQICMYYADLYNLSNSPENWQFVHEAHTVSRSSDGRGRSHSHVLLDSTVIH